VSEVSNQELLARYIALNDESAQVAFATLVRRHAAMVLRVCEQIVGDRHTAEDVFQATFMILARKAGSIRQPELLGQWLHGVAIRTAREARMRETRRRRRETPTGVDIDREPQCGEWGIESSLVRREEFEALHAELARSRAAASFPRWPS
jgi:RNA polymerase sigma factor (sigma-70 family)